MSDTPATVLLEIHTDALAGMRNAPRHFAKWAALAADEDYPDADLSEDLFHTYLVSGDEALRALWSRRLTAWDFAEAPHWAVATPLAPMSAERRCTTGSNSESTCARR